jgi:hypothetical protein
MRSATPTLNAATSAGRSAWPGPLVALALALGLFATWLAAHAYLGIRHDAIFYSFLALARLSPEALGGDLFVRYGSQDAWTLFSPLYAALVARLGLENAALLLALVGQALFWIAAARLCARLLDDRQRWFAFALLLAWPGAYGSHDVFAYAEFFVSPRIFAEAAVLAALAATLGGRLRSVALPALAAGFVLHPIMAMPGALATGLLAQPARGVRWLAGLLAAGTLLAAAIAAFAPVGPLALFDPEWLAIVRERSPYLFIDTWSLLDWQRAAVPLATLGVALAVLGPGPLHELARAALAVAFAGLVLAALFSTVLPLVLGVQGQAWRWSWIAKLVAVVALVPLAVALWPRGGAGRGTLALLALAWTGSEDSLGLPAALVALGCALTMRTRPRAAAWAAWAATALLAVPLASVSGLGPSIALAAAALAGVALVLWARGRGVAALAALGVVSAAAAGVSLRATLERPDAVRFTPAALAAFEGWRARIPRDRSVLWAESGTGAWFLLGRRNYLSASQTVGVVFSRRAALELRERAAAVDEYKSAAAYLGWRPTGTFDPQLTPALAQRLCNLPELDYIVRDRDLPRPSSETWVGGALDDYELIDCRDVRDGRWHGTVARGAT